MLGRGVFSVFYSIYYYVRRLCLTSRDIVKDYWYDGGMPPDNRNHAEDSERQHYLRVPVPATHLYLHLGNRHSRIVF